MPVPTPETARLAELYRLALLHQRRRGPAGELLGSGTGSSLEFQDRRSYAPGDDVRHLDWRALARTDTLYVRQYREEILPRVDLLIDGSGSMAVEDEKAQLTVDLAELLAGAAVAGGFQVAVVVLGDRPDRLEADRLRAAGIAFEARSPLTASLREAGALLRPGSLRVLVSDFLSPHAPQDLVRGLARSSGGLGLLQVLGRADLEPPQDAALRLTDAESGEALDLMLDGRARTRYLERLEKLVAGLRSECLRAGASFVQLDAGVPLAEHCRGILSRERVLAPA